MTKTVNFLTATTVERKMSHHLACRRQLYVSIKSILISAMLITPSFVS